MAQQERHLDLAVPDPRQKRKTEGDAFDLVGVIV